MDSDGVDAWEATRGSMESGVADCKELVKNLLDEDIAAQSVDGQLLVENTAPLCVRLKARLILTIKRCNFLPYLS